MPGVRDTTLAAAAFDATAKSRFNNKPGNPALSMASDDEISDRLIYFPNDNRFRKKKHRLVFKNTYSIFINLCKNARRTKSAVFFALSLDNRLFLYVSTVLELMWR